MGKRDQLPEEDYTAAEEEKNPFLDETFQGLEDDREKRRTYGNRYADNKSYGFWISALNKADNTKRSAQDPGEDSSKIEEMESNY